jgi:Fic family protein
MSGDKPDMEAAKQAAKQAATQAAEDRGEAVSMMEPLFVRENARLAAELADLALELTARSTGLRRSLPNGIVTALSTLVRSMNCYYTNLIEGHDTHPIDIERALKEDYSQDPRKRDLQLEARAHIEVQKWIDEGGLNGKATSTEGLLEIHRRFCELLPEDLQWVENPDTGEKMRSMPGELRTRDVRVGRHVPVSPGALPRFMRRFEEGYAGLGKVDSVIASATAHHRLLWMHPFLDGNGRVARLMSYAMLKQTLNTGGIWSVARGLARQEGAYKAHLIAGDLPRRNDLDGWGNLSEETLGAFARFFLGICIDQVEFMETLMQPDRLRDRILIWAEREIRAEMLPGKSGAVLEAVLYRGELPRGDVAGLLDMSERSARRVTSRLLDRGILVAESPRAPLRLAFPATLGSEWMPGLFPDSSASSRG